MSAQIDDSIHRLQNAFDTEIFNLQEKLTQVEGRLTALEAATPNVDNPHTKEYDSSNTLVVFGVKYDSEENVVEKAEKIIKEGIGLQNVPVVRALRTPQRDGKPGVLKVQLRSTEEKIKVLKHKQDLKKRTW